jgi:hypothetical protein
MKCRFALVIVEERGLLTLKPRLRSSDMQLKGTKEIQDFYQRHEDRRSKFRKLKVKADRKETKRLSREAYKKVLDTLGIHTTRINKEDLIDDREFGCASKSSLVALKAAIRLNRRLSALIAEVWRENEKRFLSRQGNLDTRQTALNKQVSDAIKLLKEKITPEEREAGRKLRQERNLKKAEERAKRK